MRRASFRYLSRPTPVIGCLSLLLAPAVAAHADSAPVSASAVNATGMTIVVDNCNDSGPGSLRNAVARALSGDTIDMTTLGCRRISLTSGAIVIPQEDLSLAGRGTAALTIDANELSSVFRHTGVGDLHIKGMTIARGFHRSDTQPQGGCIYSAGSIELSSTLVHWCHVSSTGTASVDALGGGLYAAGAIALTNTQVVGNTAGHAVPHDSYGGGIYALDRLTARDSRICGNHAANGGGAWSNQGGMEVLRTTFSGNTGGAFYARWGDSVLANSNISGNQATYYGNVVFDNYRYAPGGSAMIVNSTISGNSSFDAIVHIWGGTKSIVNSTIAFNQRLDRSAGYCGVNEGTVFVAGASIHVDSTIMANNLCDEDPYYDIGVYSDTGKGVIEGANNLIMSSVAGVTLPSDTISLDPLLAPLADNGGRTRTHALQAGSPAVDMGNNAAGLSYDQRGVGYPRVKGLRTDIGAFER